MKHNRITISPDPNLSLPCLSLSLSLLTIFIPFSPIFKSLNFQTPSNPNLCTIRTCTYRYNISYARYFARSPPVLLDLRFLAIRSIGFSEIRPIQLILGGGDWLGSHGGHRGIVAALRFDAAGVGAARGWRCGWDVVDVCFLQAHLDFPQCCCSRKYCEYDWSQLLFEVAY